MADIIDNVGGIVVTIPVAFDGRSVGLHLFPAGTYTLMGDMALEYATAPSYLDQWSGFDRQTQVLIALLQKMLSNEILHKIPSLIPQFLQLVTTDYSLQQITDLVCIVQQISSDRIAVGGVEPSDITYGASGVLYPNAEAIRIKVQAIVGKP